MMTNKTLNANQKAEFDCLIDECRRYVEDLKVMEEEKEFADRAVADEESQPMPRSLENLRNKPQEDESE